MIKINYYLILLSYLMPLKNKYVKEMNKFFYFNKNNWKKELKKKKNDKL